jgi:hypothetical protein
MPADNRTYATTAGFACAAASSRTSLTTATLSTLPVPSSGIFSIVMISAGTISSEAPRERANAWNSLRVASFRWVSRTSR